MDDIYFLLECPNVDEKQQNKIYIYVNKFNIKQILEMVYIYVCVLNRLC